MCEFLQDSTRDGRNLNRDDVRSNEFVPIISFIALVAISPRVELFVGDTKVEVIRSKLVELRVVNITDTLEFKVATTVCSKAGRRSKNKDIEAGEKRIKISYMDTVNYGLFSKKDVNSPQGTLHILLSSLKTLHPFTAIVQKDYLLFLLFDLNKG